MLGGHALPSQASGPPARARRKASWLLAAALILTAGVIWAAPARAGHDDEVYCEVHDAYYGPAHFRRHPNGYVVLARGGYHFYPNPHYAALVSGYAGRPAVFVSGGYFYPLWIGYGPPHVVHLPRHPHGRAHRHPRHSAVWKFD